ncbi:DUF4831 family protein [Porphyromonas somerae]|uniref:DUF4831 family protein n=1 Tax=Porphyromonas somerae TaxID=322095 RepID=UPI001FCC1FCF|nr:DUF4831 family protein [Porphyromonas somerae]BDE82827.1 hypothetical protein CE91St14_18550 [Porphyromonas somerae]
MKQYKTYKLLYLLVALLTSYGCATAQKVERYSVGALNDNRVVYALPQTILYLQVTSEVTKEIPGELSLYAERYLGTTNAVLEPALKYQLKSIEVGTRGVADEEQRFSIDFRKNSTATNVSLTEDGVLVGINLQEEVTLPTPLDIRSNELRWAELPEVRFPLEYIQATTAAAKAKVLADNIYRIRESRDLVVSGESEQPFADGKALEIAVKRLDTEEAAFTRQFNGVRQSQEIVQLADHLSATEEGRHVVARFSTREGLLPAEDLRGEPIYLEIKVVEQATPLDEKEQKRLERRLSKGIVYCVPGTVRATITYRGQVLESKEVPVAQLGNLEALDMVLFNTKGHTTSVELYPMNGGLKEVKEVNL